MRMVKPISNINEETRGPDINTVVEKVLQVIGNIIMIL